VILRNLFTQSFLTNLFTYWVRKTDRMLENRSSDQQCLIQLTCARFLYGFVEKGTRGPLSLAGILSPLYGG